MPASRSIFGVTDPHAFSVAATSVTHRALQVGDATPTTNGRPYRTAPTACLALGCEGAEGRRGERELALVGADEMRLASPSPQDDAGDVLTPSGGDDVLV
jgi:hypothetical protein